MIRFGPWMPDEPDFTNKGVTIAKNVKPGVECYLPMQGLSESSDALDARCQGAFGVRDKSENAFNFAGDATKLYKLENNSWSDVSRGGGYNTSSTETWEFTRWGNNIIATNFSDEPQQMDLSGSGFSNLTTEVKFRHLAIVRQFVVGGYTSDTTDGVRPSRVRWSAIGNETDWTVSSATQSDYQELRGRQGAIQAIRGGEYGVVFQETSIWRMSYVGSPEVFQFDETLPGFGTPSPNSVVQWGDIIYFLGQDGFYAVRNGAELIPIGSKKVNRAFSEEVGKTPDRIIGAVDPRERLVMWAYTGPGATNDIPNKLIMYNYETGWWSTAEISIEFLYNSLGQATTLEELDNVSSSIDALSESLDSAVWKGGQIAVGAFSANNKLGFFTGPALDAEIETLESQLFPGQRAMITSLRPLVDGADRVYARLGTRNRQQDNFSFGSRIETNSNGECFFRNNARYHRVRVTITGGFTKAIGVEAIANPAGAR